MSLKVHSRIETGIKINLRFFAANKLPWCHAFGPKEGSPNVSLESKLTLIMTFH